MSTYLGTGVAGVCANQLWGVNWHMHRHTGPADIGVLKMFAPKKSLPLFDHIICFLWPPYGIRQAIIFLSCGFFLSIFLFFFSHLISAAADRMSTILPHMVKILLKFDQTLGVSLVLDIQ